MSSRKDRKCMEMAIGEMRESRHDPEHTDKPDPLVGVVLVTPTGEKYPAHRANLRDGDHAEEALLERTLHDKDLEGSTLYVTLEPCSSRGSRTPCAQLIKRARIRRVFIGILDPNPDIEERGVAYLRKRPEPIEVHFFDNDLVIEIEKENKKFVEFYEQKQRRALSQGAIEELASSSGQDKQPVPRAHISALSLNVIRKYVAAAERSYNVPSPELWEHFKERGFLCDHPDGELVTTAGLTLFGNTPHMFLPLCKIKADAFSGTFEEGSLAETVKGDGLRDITGPLIRMVDEVERFFRKHVNKGVPHFEGSRRVIGTEYPWLAVREATVNALVHRDYSKPAHVLFQIFRDRIVVKSPGLMVRPNTPGKIKTGEVVPVRRNELIAAAMFELGYMEERGNGFERIAKYLRTYNLRDADYREEGGFFTVTLYGRALTPISSRLPSELKAQLNERHLLGLSILKERGRITSEEYRDVIANKLKEISRETANQDFRKLLELGLIEKRGSGKGTHYVLAGM